MKRQNLTIDRIAYNNQTANHTTIMLMNFKLDFSFEKLFAVTYVHPQPNVDDVVFCRHMYESEKKHSGQHFNTVQPNHKSRFSPREWKKHCNSLLKNFHLDV